jgi:hypothetical protein
MKYYRLEYYGSEFGYPKVWNSVDTFNSREKAEKELTIQKIRRLDLDWRLVEITEEVIVWELSTK